MLNAGPRMPHTARGRKPGVRSVQRTNARVSPTFKEALAEALKQTAKNPPLLTARPVTPNSVVARAQRKKKEAARRAGKQ